MSSNEQILALLTILMNDRMASPNAALRTLIDESANQQVNLQNQILQSQMSLQLAQQQWNLKQQLLEAQTTGCRIIEDYKPTRYEPIGTWPMGARAVKQEEELRATNCRNCGAPLRTNKCDYCDTINR